MPIYKDINKKFFKKWSEEMAYVLGFIFADGNIIYTKRNTWFLSIQITDKDILMKIREVMNSSHVISKRKTGKKNKNLYRLQIGSKEICSDLIKLGVIERKSNTMSFPIVPNEYFSDFLRGYFDGDGGVWVGPKNKRQNIRKYVISTFFTSGSKDFLVVLAKLLKKRGIKGDCIVKKERGYDLKYSINDSLILYKIMYNSRCSLFLVRKREKFEKYIKMRS